MGLYYFDIETTHFEPDKGEIISIQRQLIENNGEPKGQLTIWKRWGENAFSEEGLVKTAYNLLMDSKNIWEIPVGYNLKFEQKWMGSKFEKLISDFNWADWFNRPMIDLHPLGILANGGYLKGSGLDKVSGKQRDGSIIPKWYFEKKYDLIEKYVKQEAESFLEFYKKCYNLLDINWVIK